ncbi:uncharacterized protein LOC105662054 [Megachile rotundata]|uniref:uncharacterized protein LOC105662054 n=1 Tax=Megachile rotundata TaxID=143995 RepID=UPI003FCFAB85
MTLKYFELCRFTHFMEKDSLYIKCFTAFFYPGLSIVILYHISPVILDVIVPLNESRPIKFSTDLEFWIEEEQYPILNISLFCLVVIVDVAVLVGTESFSIMICLHTAGLFDVASYYFEKAVLLESVSSYRPRKIKDKESINHIATGVLFHLRCLQDVHDTAERCKAVYSFITILGVITASISLFCLSVMVLQLSDIRETIFFVLVLIATFGYMFWLSLAVQYVIDSADSMPLKTYNTNWYETSIATQKLLQMIILKSNKSVSLNFFSILTPSIGCFAMVYKY